MYAQILNSFVSTEGSNGMMTNYVYYSVLVAYDDGRKEIVEGKARDIAPIMSYVKTPMDDLIQIRREMDGLVSRIDEMVENKIDKIVSSLFTIPDIKGKNEVEAEKLIIASGLIPRHEHEYPDGTPKNGIVKGFHRIPDRFKEIVLDIRHDVPNIIGDDLGSALVKLKNAGFTVKEKITQVTPEKKDDIILNVSRADSYSMDVTLTVSKFIPDVVSMTMMEAQLKLSSAGYRTEIIEEILENSTSGVVLRYEVAEDCKTVKLFVSKTAYNLDTKKVTCEATQTIGSTGDTYNARAHYDQTRQELEVSVQMTPKGKNKYVVNPDAKIRVDAGSHSSEKLKGMLRFELQPNVESGFRILTKNIEQPEKLPKEAWITLETTYGSFSKKNFNIDIHLTFEWDVPEELLDKNDGKPKLSLSK